MSDPKGFDYTEFDKLLMSNGPVVLSLQQKLKVAAISGDDIVFPPSYAPTPKRKDADDKSAKKDKDNEKDSVYNIDVLDPLNPFKNVCVLDSIPSQANRIEPIFASDDYKSLVPQYTVKLNDEVEPVSILSVGHRLADAVFRGTTLREDIVKAFKSYAKGNAAPIAKLGATSLVFGVWDSRGTGVKVPRLINSIVRAFDVVPLRRSAQYTPPIKYKQEGLLPPGLDIDPAEHGLADVPSPLKIGGVQVNGEIRRDCSLNLELIRNLKGKDDKDKDVTEELRRYVLGLALIALTATPPATLRQGCTLIPQTPSDNPHDSKSEEGKAWKPQIWRKFYTDGRTDEWDFKSLNIREFAAAAASDFGVVQPPKQLLFFDKNLLKASIEEDAKKKADKKTQDAGDPIDNLKKLVNELEPAKGDKLSEAKTKPLAKLQEAVAKIESDSTATEELKRLAAGLRPLLIADAGAAARKTQMLALFPAVPEPATEEAK